jgi:hypothetical protein
MGYTCTAKLPCGWYLQGYETKRQLTAEERASLDALGLGQNLGFMPSEVRSWSRSTCGEVSAEPILYVTYGIWQIAAKAGDDGS